MLGKFCGLILGFFCMPPRGPPSTGNPMESGSMPVTPPSTHQHSPGQYVQNVVLQQTQQFGSPQQPQRTNAYSPTTQTSVQQTQASVLPPPPAISSTQQQPTRVFGNCSEVTQCIEIRPPGGEAFRANESSHTLQTCSIGCLEAVM